MTFVLNYGVIINPRGTSNFFFFINCIIYLTRFCLSLGKDNRGGHIMSIFDNKNKKNSINYSNCKSEHET